MPDYKSVDYNLIDIDSISEDTFKDVNELNKISEKVMVDLGNKVAEVFGARDFLNSFDKNYMFKHVLIDGEILSDVIDEKDPEKAWDEPTRNRLGTLMLLKAQMKGEPIVVVPEREKETDKGIVINSNFPNADPVKLNWVQLILSLFGFYSKEVEQIKRREDIIANADKLAEESMAVKPEEKSKIVEENLELMDQLVEKNINYRQLYNKQSKEFVRSVFKDCDPADFTADDSKEILSPSNLHSTANFNKRATISMVACMLMRDGFTIKEICSQDPANEKLNAAKSKVGKEIVEFSKAIANKDMSISLPARQRLSDIYAQGQRDIVKQELPSENELDNYLDSDNPFYLFTLASVGFDVSQELERSRDNGADALSTARLRNECDIASSATLTGKLNNLLSPLQSQYEHFKNDITLSDEENRDKMRERLCNYMGGEAEKNFMNEVTLRPDNVKTLGDYAILNQSSSIQANAFGQIARYYANSRLGGLHANPIKLKDVIENKVSIKDSIGRHPDFAEINLGKQNRIKQNGGYLDEVDAKLKVASSIVATMISIANDDEHRELLEQKSEEIIDGIFANKTFNSMLENLKPSQIEEKAKDQNFFKDFIINSGKKEISKEDVKNADTVIDSKIEVGQKQSNKPERVI